MRLLVAIYAFHAGTAQSQDACGFLTEAPQHGQEVTLLTSPGQQLPECTRGLRILQPSLGGALVPQWIRFRRFADAFAQAAASGEYDRTIALDELPGADCHISLVYNETDQLFPEGFAAWFSPAARLRYALRQQLYLPPSATRICYLSRQQYHLLQNRFGLPQQRLFPLPPGLPSHWNPPESEEETSQCRASLLKRLSLPASARLILQCTDHWKEHGVDLALQSLAHMPAKLRAQCHFLLCSSIGDDNSLAALANECGFPFRQVHVIPRDGNLRPLFLGADLLIHPARQATATPVLLQALASHLPVICTSLCTYSAYVQNAGCPVIPANPIHRETIDDALAFTLPQLAVLRHAVSEYAARHRFGARTEAFLDILANHCPRQHSGAIHLKPDHLELILEEHRRQIDASSALKNQAKRAVTRVKTPKGSFIVKEFRPRWFGHHKALCQEACDATRLMRGYTPPCTDPISAPNSRSAFLVLQDCGAGNFYETAYSQRPNSTLLYHACGALLADLHTSGLYHADTKPTNFVANDLCQNSCNRPVCLVDCDHVTRYQPPVPMSLRIRNAAQFLAGTGKLARMDEKLWHTLLKAFCKGYETHANLNAAEIEQFWHQVRLLIVSPGKIEVNLPPGLIAPPVAPTEIVAVR